jgi:hypothetical protein
VRRLLVGVASLGVALASFGLVTWAIGGLSGRGPARASLPGLERTTPQPVSAPPPVEAPFVSGPAAAADPDELVRAAARAAEAVEEAARERVVARAREADEPLEVRLDLYRAALGEALHASGDAAMLAWRGIWTEHFLRLDPVQEELASLSPGRRALALARIRREMGFDDEEIERLAALDARREQRWDTGLAYMEERDRLESRLEGDAFEEEVQRLREAYFGVEAHTLAMEEASGFFRFERRRIYGRN